MTLDRVNNDLGYSPENCRWVTNKQQCNNTRKNVVIEYLGKTQTLTEWCEELGMSYYMVQRRLKKGWSVEKAFTKKSQLETSWSRKCMEKGLNPATVSSRIELGWSLERALNTPTKGRGANAKSYQTL